MATDNLAEKKVSTNRSPESRTMALLWSELLFVVLPFLVLALVSFHKESSPALFLLAPEWAFASTILFGQTIVKLVSAATEFFGNPITENIALIVTMLMVLGVVPSMVVLTMILLAASPPTWLGVAQVFLFIMSVGLFLLIGGVSQSKVTEEVDKLKRAYRLAKTGAES